MSKFSITNESTEDTFGVTDDLGEAIRMAKEVAKAGPVGDLVLVEYEGKGVRQFILTHDGQIEENQIPELGRLDLNAQGSLVHTAAMNILEAKPI